MYLTLSLKYFRNEVHLALKIKFQGPNGRELANSVRF